MKGRAILLFTLLGFALRLAFLSRQSLWFDEAFSLAVAGAEPPVFWAALLSDGVHPPGYYLLLRGSLELFGDCEFALRFLSVVAGTLAVPLIGRLGRALGGGRCPPRPVGQDRLVQARTGRRAGRGGMAAALLLAINPFALWYAQEARMYSLLLCLTIAGGYTFWQLVARPTPTRWLWLVLISALSFVVHYFAFVFSLVQFVYLVVNLRQTYRVLRWWVAAQAVACLPFLPWTVAIATREGRNFGIGWIHAPTLLDLPLTLSNLALALSDPASPWTWAGLLVVLLAAGGGAVCMSSLHPASPTADRRPPTVNLQPPTSNCPSPTPYSFLLLWLVVPLAFTWLISLRLPLYVDRFLIICLPPLLLLSSTISLSSSWVARSTMTVLVMVSAFACVRLWTDPSLSKEDWRVAASYVQSMEKPGDGLVMRDVQTGIPFGYYYRGALRPQAAVINQQTTPLDDLVTGHDRLWLVYRRPFEPTHALAGSRPFTWQDDPDPLVHAWLVSHQAALARERTFPGVYVVLYQLSPSGGTVDRQN